MGKGLESMAARLASGQVRTAGKIEFIRDQGPLRRDIRVQGFEWAPDVYRDLSKVLWASERAHSYAMSALRLFSRLPSSKFSPDGMLGGRGYIQQVREMRSALSQAVETLSSFTDTVHDEVNAPHWAAVDDESAKDILEDVQDVKENPMGFVEDQYRTDVLEEPETVANPDPDELNPFLEGTGEDDDEDDLWDWDAIETQVAAAAHDPDYVLLGSITDITEDKEIPLPGPRSELPSDESVQEEALGAVEMIMNTTGEHPRGNKASRRADSSVDPSTLPGPRVMHVGPGESPEEFGYFSDLGQERPSDDPAGEGFSHLDRVVESPVSDGTTGYTDATQGDETVFKASAARLSGARLADNYSWLPGSGNEKNLNYYELGLSEEEVQWMRANNQPDPPPGMDPTPSRPQTDHLWELVRS